MTTYQRKVNPSKENILLFTAGGIIYFYLKIPGLNKRDENTCYNVSSPFRSDRNPSYSVTRDPSTNRWYAYDYGRPGSRVDVFSFAAQLYELNIGEDFPLVLEKMSDDLKIYSFKETEIEKLLNGERTNIDFSHIIGKRSTVKREVESNQESEYEVVLWEKSETELLESEQQYLKKYGITWQSLKATDTHFISGYSSIYESYTKPRYAPNGEIWIAYKFNGGAKIYCPYPKKFWHVGTRPKNHRFGTPQVNPQFQDETIVFLVGGEKDVLSLISRGFEAMCLNSETASISRDDFKYWYYDCHYKVIVMYDIDETGIAQAEKLNKELGITYILLPQWLKEKGGKDISDFFLLGGTVEELNTIVKEQTQNDKRPELIKQHNEQRLKVRTALQRISDARLQEDICPFFDVFFQKGELVITFGDTGKGKSIAAVSLADAISKGQSFLGMQNAYGPTIVLYYDFELSDKQFEKRYSNDRNEVYPFSDNFYIDNLDVAEITPDKSKKESFETLLIDRIKTDIDSTKAEVVIIDNITFLTSHSAEDSQVALTIMRKLKELKTEKGISILVLAHTPKKTNPSGVTIQDLAGSKHLSNFADGVFALGHSTNDTGLRYFIQVKPSRSGELKYDKENVLVCEIEKKDNFLTLIPKGFSNERELLKQSDADPEVEEKLVEKAKALKAEGKTIRQIADILNLSKSKVGRWLNEGGNSSQP